MSKYNTSTEDFRYTLHDGFRGIQPLATQMYATLDADKLSGSPPRPGALAAVMQSLREAWPEEHFIRGHLLNEHLGGKGDMDNLYPITSSANSEHSRDVEEPLKGAYLGALNLIEQDSNKYGPKASELLSPAFNFFFSLIEPCGSGESSECGDQVVKAPMMNPSDAQEVVDLIERGKDAKAPSDEIRNVIGQTVIKDYFFPIQYSVEVETKGNSTFFPRSELHCSYKSEKMPQALESGKVSIPSDPKSYFAFDTLPGTWAGNYNEEHQFNLYSEIVRSIDAFIDNNLYAFSDDNAEASDRLQYMADQLSNVADKLRAMANHLQGPVPMEIDDDFLN